MGVEVGIRSLDDRRQTDEVELRDDELLALVEIDRSGMHLAVCACLVDRPEQLTRLRDHDPEDVAGRRPDVDASVRGLVAALMECSRPANERPPIDQPFGGIGARRTEEAQDVLVGDRQLARRAREMGLHHVGVRRIDPASSGGRSKRSLGWATRYWSSGSSWATRIASEPSLRRPARPACCHIDARVPG